MPDNINISINETTENVVINPSISTDVIDFNLYATAETVNISVTPELTTVNINSVTGGGLVTSVNGQIGDVVIPSSDNNFTTALKNKLDGIQAGAEVNVNADWNSISGDSQILNKPTIPSISGLATVTYVDTQDALKVDKIAGKGLSENDFTNTLKTKLDSVQSGAEVNVNADWNSVSGDSQILNKPSIPSIAGLATTAYVDNQDALKVDKVEGKGLSANDYTTTEKNKLAGIASGAEVNVNADWNAVSGDAQILNKPTISGTNTGDQNLQQVTDLGASTTTSITANSFVKSGGTSSQILAADGSVITQGNNITITGGIISSVGGTGGGGSSVNYYLNGGTSQGTFGGSTYYEFSKTAVIGTGADFSRGTNGYIASFITDVADPSLLLIPAGNWNLEFFFNSSSNGGSPSFYVELYKYDGTTFTLIASNSATPEGITNGTSIDAYFTALAVPETVLTVNDRLAIRVFVNASSKTITLHTQNGHLCEVITTFTAGLTALNGLQAQVQNFATGTTGTDFDIVSSGSTHTFNLPSASATARGVVTTGSQTFAGDKTFTGAISASNLSGTNTGDETITTIKTKLGITTLSGVNTGDQDLSNLVVKNTAITGATKTKITYDSKGLVTAGADATTADIADSTNKRYVTDANLTTIANQSGTNTGDETTATIKTKLGITTLSGSNTGDQDLSGLATKATSISTTSPLQGGGDLSANRTLSILQSNTSQSGFLSSTDWNTFNSAYQGKINSATITGTEIKTLTLNQQSGGTITANFSIYDSMEIFYNVSTLQDRTIADGGTFEAKKCLFNQLSNLNNI